MALLRAYLSVEETARAAALRRARDRERFAAAHGWLRHLLGAELGCHPADVPIITSPSGKPEVWGTDIRFSVSCSNELGLFAIACGTDVGVDVEAIGPEADIDRVAAIFFSPTERGALADMRYAERLRSSFECWTCKEAYVKGTGRGLDDDVRTFETWTGDGKPARVGDWFVHPVEVASGFAAALAIHRGANPVIEIQGARIG